MLSVARNVLVSLLAVNANMTSPSVSSSAVQTSFHDVPATLLRVHTWLVILLFSTNPENVIDDQPIDVLTFLNGQ